MSAVRLARLTDDVIPPPPRPDLGKNGDALLDALDRRFELIPFHRVRRRADYWALLGVEEEHVAKLAREQCFSVEVANTLRQYWEQRIESHLAPTLDRLERSGDLDLGGMRTARGRPGSGVLFQLWFNTFGPGGRTWFGNRYTTVRHHTFRVHWRP